MLSLIEGLTGRLRLSLTAGCLVLLTACQTVNGAAGKQASSEDLQKATYQAMGVAWETVTVSDVQRSATDVKWVAATRSNRWHCTAAPDGSKPYCER